MGIIYDQQGNVIGTGDTEDVASSPINPSNTEPTYPNRESRLSRDDDTGLDRIQSLSYPLTKQNNHFVRFYINIDEESRLVRKNKVQTTGVVDNTDQHRANRGLSDRDAIEAGVNVAAVALGGSAVSSGIISIFRGKRGLTKLGGAAGVTAGAGAIGASFVFDDKISAIIAEEFQVTKRLKRLASSITLYTPAGINSSYGMNYSITDDILIDLAQSDRYEQIKQGLSLNNAASSLGAFARVLAVSANETVQNLSRTARNPKKDVLFRNVDNREFVFDYQFAPKSKEEAKAVSDIIYMFKFFAHPEVLEGYAQFLYLYPAEFDIEYGFIDENGVEKENEHINKISSCVLQRVSINYASNGSYQSLVNGEPVVTNVSLRFMEIETLHQDRIRKGY